MQPQEAVGEVRVLRRWPGGPAKGETFTPEAGRRRQLLKAGLVEACQPIAPPRRRGTPHRPEQAETDLLEQRSTKG